MAAKKAATSEAEKLAREAERALDGFLDHLYDDHRDDDDFDVVAALTEVGPFYDYLKSYRQFFRDDSGVFHERDFDAFVKDVYAARDRKVAELARMAKRRRR